MGWIFSGIAHSSAKTTRHGQNVLSYVPKKILTWVLRDPSGGLKVAVGDRVTAILSLYHIVFLFLSVSFNMNLVFPSRLCSKACQHI